MNIEIMTLYSPVPRGTPTESKLHQPWAFDKLITENNLPKVVFHSLRHTSTTYKLKLSVATLKLFRVTPGTHRPQWSWNGMPIS